MQRLPAILCITLALLLTASVSTGSCGRVRFVHDDQVGSVVEERPPVSLRLDVVNADDQMSVVLVNANVWAWPFSF